MYPHLGCEPILVKCKQNWPVQVSTKGWLTLWVSQLILVTPSILKSKGDKRYLPLVSPAERPAASRKVTIKDPRQQSTCRPILCLLARLPSSSMLSWLPSGKLTQEPTSYKEWHEKGSHQPDVTFTMMVFGFLAGVSVIQYTRTIRNVHRTSHTFDINLTCTLINRYLVHFDAQVLASFVKCCMSRRRHNSEAEKVNQRSDLIVHKIPTVSYNSGSLIPFTVRAQSR